MKKLALLIFLSLSAAAQTFQYQAHVAINAGQCVAILGLFVAPCNNFPVNGFPPVPVGVALTSVAAVSKGHTTITVQYAGLVTVPDTSFGLINSGDLLGDLDGTGNLNDFGTPQGGPVYVGLGPTYAGIALGEAGGFITMIVQPGYIPQPCGGCIASAVTGKKKPPVKAKPVKK